MKRKAKDIPLFSIEMDDTEKTGVNLISFVQNPAIEAGFVALSTQRNLLLSASGDKQILTGPVLIPEKEILRLSEDKKPFLIKFSAETIEAIQKKFHKNNFTQATNEEHELPLDGNYLVESWIIADAEKDKAVALGLKDLPPGTWMASYHVPDPDFWNGKVKTGAVTGFSLEGIFNMQEVKEELKAQLSEINMTVKKTGVAGFFSRLFSAALTGTPLKLAEMTLEDGTAIIMDDETKEVFRKDEDGEPGEALADGTYTLSGDDAKTITVKDGKLAEEEEKPDPEQQLAATDLAAGDYNLPGGDVLTVTETEYSIKKAESAPGETEMSVAMKAALEQTRLSLADVELSDGTKVVHDPIAGKLYKEDGSLLPSGEYSTKDGTKFKVSTEEYTSQYWYEVKERLSADLKASQEATAAKEQEAVELKRQKEELEVKLSRIPAAAKLKLAGDKGDGGSTEKALTPGERRFQLRLEKEKSNSN